MSANPEHKIRVGITGQAGFVGTHVFNALSLEQDQCQLIPFQDDFFATGAALDLFVRQCDVIVHLAAMNRHAEPEVLYRTNIELVKKLIESMERTSSKPYVIMSSSLQEERDNIYGRSKREGRELLNQWADRTGARFTGLIIPNVFGPFGVPFYNSVISTFSYQLTHNQEPRIEIDADLKLIYVGTLVRQIIDLALNKVQKNPQPERLLHIKHQASYRVTELLKKLLGIRECYMDKGILPDLQDRFEIDLFNTFRSYLPASYFPRKLFVNSDARGIYVEAVKSLYRGQTSFSTTVPGITRGNHFHTRKVERFAVIKGKASIKLRKYGSPEIVEYILDGAEPAYVDMPVWFTHNITNIGDQELFTLFWINEFYDPTDPDTYFEEVEPPRTPKAPSI